MAEVTLDQVPQKVQNLFNKGFAAFERGNLDYAIDLLSSCVEMEPGLLQARKFLRAAEVRKLKRNKVTPLTHVIFTIKGLPSYLAALALLKSNKPAQAVVVAEKLLRMDPLNGKFFGLFAQAATRADMPDAAIQTLEVARDHYPDDVEIINWLGELYLTVGNTRSARECFEKLCEICPNDPKAQKALKDATALDSMAADGWAQVAEKGGSYRDIIKDTKEATLLEQEAKAVKGDADTDALIASYRDRIKAEPAHMNHYLALAKLYSQKAMFDEAGAALKKAIAISPGDPELANMLTAVRIQQYDYEISQLKNARNTAAAAAKETEKLQFMADDLQERVNRYPNDLKLRYEWGVMLFDHDYVNESIQHFQLSQKSPKHRVKSLYYLALCFKHKKQFDLALTQLEKAASEIPLMNDTKKDILYELGDVSYAMGDTQKAALYYKQIYEVDIGYKDIAAKIEHAYVSG